MQRRTAVTAMRIRRGRPGTSAWKVNLHCFRAFAKNLLPEPKKISKHRYRSVFAPPARSSQRSAVRNPPATGFSSARASHRRDAPPCCCDYRRYRKFAWALFITAVILLAGVLIFGKRITLAEEAERTASRSQPLTDIILQVNTALTAGNSWCILSV